MQEHNKQHKSEKINTKENSESTTRKPVDSKKSLMFVISVVLIIITIIAGTILLSKYVFKDKNTIEYNHYIFIKYEKDKWITQQVINGQLYDMPFYNNPTEVLDIYVNPEVITKIRQFRTNKNGTLYVSVDPTESSKGIMAAIEYARILGNVYNIYNMNVKSAITQEVNITLASPVITCSNQSKDVFVIMQYKSDKNLINIENNCVTIEYLNVNESVRVADAFAFRLLNIIQE